MSDQQPRSLNPDVNRFFVYFQQITVFAIVLAATVMDYPTAIYYLHLYSWFLLALIVFSVVFMLMPYRVFMEAFVLERAKTKEDPERIQVWRIETQFAHDMRNTINSITIIEVLLLAYAGFYWIIALWGAGWGIQKLTNAKKQSDEYIQEHNTDK